jgi:uncharacterized protein
LRVRVPPSVFVRSSVGERLSPRVEEVWGSNPHGRFSMKQDHSISAGTLRIGKAGKLGRGVFAVEDFGIGDLIEGSPLIVIDDPREALIVEQLTVLGSYCFEYGDGKICLALGFASLYNHSPNPNAVYTILDDRIEVHALKKIKAGRQIKVNYNGDPRDKTPINFEEWSRA